MIKLAALYLSINSGIYNGEIMSKTAKLAAHLENGKAVTAKELQDKVALANPHDAVRTLRM